MRSFSRFITTRCVCLLLWGSLGAGLQRDAGAAEKPMMPPGAFLRTPAGDVAALNRELRADSLVTARYSRLLHLSPEMVRATFAQLHLTHLRQDMILKVHYVHAGETIGAKMRRVRKGTAVFALPNGTPLLAQVCGNPLRNGNPAIRLILHPRASEDSPSGAQVTDLSDVPDFDPMEPLNMPSPSVHSTTITLREAVPPLGLPESPDRLDPDEIPTDTVEAGEILPASPIALAESALTTWVNGGALLGVAGGLIGIGGTGPSPTLLPTIRAPLPSLPGSGGRGNPGAPNATPEPNGAVLILALAASLLASIGLHRRKTRQRNSGEVRTVQ